jgi:hypothetical protein
MEKTLVVALLMLFAPHLSAQERVLLKGKVIVDSIVAPIHIINVTAEKGSLTQASGDFEMAVMVGDLVLFSSVQFQKKELLITAGILESGFLKVPLIVDINELDEVRLHQLSGSLTKDISEIETYDPLAVGIPLSDRKPLSVEERKLSALSSPMDPVGLIYGVFSGERKRLKKAIENNELRTLVLKGRDLLPQEFYTETLKLENNQIIDFVYFCSRKSVFEKLVNKSEAIQLIRFFKEMIPEYHAFVED